MVDRLKKEEIRIGGVRDDTEKHKLLDFSLCGGKFVAEYGCNPGQTAIKAAKGGARRVIGFDSQEEWKTTMSCFSDTARNTRNPYSR